MPLPATIRGALETNSYKAAIEAWRDVRSADLGVDCASVCFWGGNAGLYKCGHCLEGRLWSMTLHAMAGSDDSVKLASGIKAWLASIGPD